MQKVEEFKDFVRQNMYLKTAVDKQLITWQKAYETYDLFGAQAADFDQLKTQVEQQTTSELNAASSQPAEATAEPMQANSTTGSTNAFASNSNLDLLTMLSSIDFNKLGSTIDQLQRVLGVVKDFAKPEEVAETKTKRVFKRYND